MKRVQSINSVPEMLLILESCIVDGIDYEYILTNTPISTLVQWEEESSILSDVLTKTNFYEEQFKAKYPVTYDRIVSIPKETRFRIGKNWKNLLLHLQNASHSIERVWKETMFSEQPSSFSTSLNDEFGADFVYQLFNSTHNLRKFSWNNNYTDSVTQNYFDKIDTLSKVWSVPFRNICLALMNERELILLHTHVPKSQLPLEMQDVRRWALNRNTFLEHVDDFVIPDLSIEREGSTKLYPLLASTSEGDCFSVILQNRVILVFDFVKAAKNKSPLHWRHLVTDELYEPNHNQIENAQITACCFVMDSFLLLATDDGVLRARPRCNPKSEYYVENLNSMVHQMTSLYNVVALIHSYHILEVRFASQKEEDPFFQLSLVYKATNVDCEHPPLLYGPYVIYKSLDQSWYRVLYDASALNVKNSPSNKEVIQIPRHAGWNILSIKNANWRFLTVVAEDAKSKRVEEFFLFSGF